MYQINNDVIYVKGAKRGAIYDLNNGDVFSINEDACKIVNKYIDGVELIEAEKEYLDLLESNNLINKSFSSSKYIPEKKRDRLRLVWLEITQACNMRCLHCYEGENHISDKNNSLSIDEWKKVIDDIANLSVDRVVIIGGEPCIHKNIKDILLYLSEKNISTTLFTNGYFLDDEMNNIITDNDINVKVSLYGQNSEVHDRITGIKGSFNRLVENIKFLVSKGVKVNIAVTLMRENEIHYDDIKKFVGQLNVSGVRFDVIREVIDGSQSNHLPVMKNIQKMAYRKKANFSIKKSDFDEYINRNTCWYSKLVVCENGDILPCVFERNVSYGNIRNNTLQEIINSNSLQACWNFDFSRVEECKDCEYRYACKDCRPLAISNNSINSKNPRCMYNPYDGEWKNG